MSLELNIHELHFGSDDAESDEKHGFLNKVFLNTPIYQRIKRNKRELVIGRKGSGKSALCLKLKKAFEDEQQDVILLSPESLSRYTIEQLKVSSISNTEAYSYIWRYVILVVIGKEILKRYNTLKANHLIGNYKDIVKKIYNFLMRNEEIDKTFFRKLLSRIPILSSLTLKVFGIEGSLTINQLKNQKEFTDNLERFQGTITRILPQIYETQLIILFDRIDEIWEDSEESEMKIIGLVKAVHDLNLILQQAQIILFLRSDIYDTLKFHDADKLHSVEERVCWAKEDLRNLIVTRARVSANLKGIDSKEIWDAIFDKKVNNKSSFEYIINRTMLRPRELIQFCNQALTKAQDNSHDYIHSQDILKAERDYSAWKLKDLVSEFTVQYPYLQELLSIFQGFKEVYKYDEFAERFSMYRERLNRKFPSLESVSIDVILQILYIIGFLGASIKEQNVFVYDDPTIVVSQAESIVIHPSFISALHIQDNRTVNVGRDYFEHVSGNVYGGNVTIQGYSEENITSGSAGKGKEN